MTRMLTDEEIERAIEQGKQRDAGLSAPPQSMTVATASDPEFAKLRERAVAGAALGGGRYELVGAGWTTQVTVEDEVPHVGEA